MSDQDVDYKEMYLKMVRASEKAINAMEAAIESLMKAQQECEEMYLQGKEDT